MQLSQRLQMIFRYDIITLVLVASIVQSIQSKKCNKSHPDGSYEVTCNDPETRSCGNASVLIDVGGTTVGTEANLSCLNGYTLWGSDSIVCLDSGQWSQLNAYCIPDDIGDPNIQSFDGSIYLFNNFTGSNYSQAKEYCTNICSTLIEINNQEEDQFVYETFQNLEIESLWIGIESVNGGNFSWQSGNTTQTNMYANWESIEPVDPEAGTCVLATPQYTFWAPVTEDCEFPTDFVCEFGSN
ncbi:PKD1L2 [Mytilus coruscus]|uniref:PKD1L2 n=1 Tax=Mytilus coruscus TaxID=42192 RepID=A0A6J8DF24_MYTCO|nr:PKD1L2 [Mytilus coruscus]